MYGRVDLTLGKMQILGLNEKGHAERIYLSHLIVNVGGAMRLAPFEVLSKDELYRLHLASLDILEEVGVKVPVEEALKLCADAGADVDFKRQIVKMPQYLVEECVKKSPHKVTLYGRDADLKLYLGEDKVYFGTVGFAPRILDMENGRYRSLNQEDLANATRVADALENIDFQMVMGQPGDVPSEVVDMYQWLIAFENTRKHIMCQVLSKESAQVAIKMGTLIAGGEDELRKSPTMAFVICLNSPLFYGEFEVEGLLEAAKFRLPALAESGPMAGANSPVTLAGTVVLNNAEVLGGLVLTKLVDPRSPFIYGSWSRSIDMRLGSVVLGGPEFALLRVCTAQLARFYNLPSSGGGLLCDSKVFDAQAGYEKMLTALMPCLSGLNLISGMGLVASETVVSYEQLVVDDEIAGMVKRVLDGIDFRDETLAIDVIKDVGLEGNFLAKKHTLQFAESEHWVPKISDRRLPDIWIRGGAPKVYQKARERALRILSEYRQPPLPKEISMELRNMIKEMEKKVLLKK